mmetsp:Transcript_13943/g.29444  ORF Transcript_13943/g.29444 Transcript_13943/m.29444 type:complete len:126 (+) Transcript_13943:117-494(+)
MIICTKASASIRVKKAATPQWPATYDSGSGTKTLDVSDGDTTGTSISNTASGGGMTPGLFCISSFVRREKHFMFQDFEETVSELGHRILHAFFRFSAYQFQHFREPFFQSITAVIYRVTSVCRLF